MTETVVKGRRVLAEVVPTQQISRVDSQNGKKFKLDLSPVNINEILIGKDNTEMTVEQFLEEQFNLLIQVMLMVEFRCIFLIS